MRIMGITSNPSTGSFISISDAGTLKVTETHSGTTVAEINPSGDIKNKYALKEMVDFSMRKVIAICDAHGQIFIYNKEGSPIEL